jgi:hypothetical protein
VNVRLQVVELDVAALRAATAILGDECALSAVTPPDHALDVRGDVARSGPFGELERKIDTSEKNSRSAGALIPGDVDEDGAAVRA